jgi:hypothetical protein
MASQILRDRYKQKIKNKNKIKFFKKRGKNDLQIQKNGL